MENKKGGTKFSKLTIAQILLGGVLLISGGFTVHEIVDGRQVIHEVESMEMAGKDELGTYQETIDEMQEEGVVYSDPFNTDREDVYGTRYLGRIEIPKIGVDESIVMGTSANNLKSGVGLMEGSDIPLGKTGESSILAGYSGYLLRGTFFRDLRKLEIGDKINVLTSTSDLEYEVIQVSRVASDEVEKVMYDEKNTLLALVTSNPYWVTEDRLLVEAELVR